MDNEINILFYFKFFYGDMKLVNLDLKSWCEENFGFEISWKNEENFWKFIGILLDMEKCVDCRDYGIFRILFLNG